MHTYYSDGRPAPEELIREAVRIGLKTIAITDHDNIRGSVEAQGLAKELGLELIPAMEFTCHWRGYTGFGGGHDMDILGYFIDFEHPLLKHYVDKAEKARVSHIKETCQVLAKDAESVSFEEVEALNPHFQGFLDIANALAKRYEIASVFDCFPIVEKAWHQIPVATPPIDEVISLVHALGGVAVLAHPSIIHHKGKVMGSSDMAALLEMGLDALEVHHYRLQQSNTTEHFFNMAKEFNIPITGGSDEHGWPEGYPRLGTQPVTREMLESIRP
jgi:predicted metal-dependent phosphoesterase TrpH